MSSPFFSELSKLDDSLRIVQSQLDKMRAGLDSDEEKLAQSLGEARQHGGALRELIRVDNAQARWSDRPALEHLILSLEIAAEEKRKQQRRTKLLELANELEQGTVKHRIRARATELNERRLKAVEQLKAEAARPEQEKELPGPQAGAWISWACSLQDEKDAPVLAELRGNFAALDEFIAGMEETFWQPGEQTQAAAPKPGPEAPPTTTTSAAAPIAKTAVTASMSGGLLPAHVRAEFEKAVQTGDFSGALSLCYDKPASEAESEAGNGSHAEAAAATSGGSPAGSRPEPPPLKFCRECGRTYPNRYNVCPFDSSALGDLPESAPEPPAEASPAVFDKITAARVKMVKDESDRATIDGQVTAASPQMARQAEEVSAPPAQELTLEPLSGFDGDSSPSFGELTLDKRPVAIWVAAGVLLALIAIFVWMHYFKALNSKGGSSVANAATTDPAATNSATDPSAAGAKPLLHREASEGAQDNILLSMEDCARTNSTGIECWGYISNERDKDSKVSLYRVDVIDGKGNSFDLARKGHTDFSDTHDFTVPAQSKVKYSIKVPDKDKEARSLTLYLDVNNPRFSEYTFRDIPITE